jgi:DNA-binding CsgD family transcriptional regulator
VDAAFATLEKLNRGVLLLGADGTVRFMNRTARAMLNRGHGLSLRKGRLTFAGADATEALDACVEQMTGSLLLRVGGPNHAHGAYSVLVSPLESRDEPNGFCVFIHEPPGKQRPVPAQVLRQLYGLTAAEARLANALYVGQSLQSAAGTGGISRNTAKTVLKRVFVKCEVGSQAELLQLLALGPRVV